MIKIKTIISAVIIAATAGLFSGCDNYLNVVPPETPDFDDAMKDKQDALGFLYSCYASLASYNGVGSLGDVECSTDEFVNPELWGRLGQITSWNQLSSTTNSNNKLFPLPWVVSYDALGQCNLFEKILSESQPKEVTLADRERWMGEIKFLKAYYHFRLLESYGPVPIIDHYYNSDTQKGDLPGRSHFDYCVDRIVEWLDEAAAVLPPTTDISDLGRANATIAKALKARVLLYAASPLWNGSFPFQGWQNTNYETPGYGHDLVSTKYDRQKWVRARNACSEALNYALSEGQRSFYTLEQAERQRQSDGVALPFIPGVDDEFKRQVMHIRYANNTVETEGNKSVVWGVISNPNSFRFYFVDHMPHNILTFNGGGRGGGICALAPVLYTIEHFYTRNGILPVDDPELPNADWLKSAGYTGHEEIIVLNDKREPRYYANISFDGDEYTGKAVNGEPLVVNARSSAAHGYNSDLFNRDNNVTGFYLKKWCAPNFTWKSDGSKNSRMIPAPFIKLSELYLNLAECEAELGNTDEALAALNVIRDQNHIARVDAGMFALMSLKDWVRNERFIELLGEAHRYYDARRWMIAPQRFKNGEHEGLNAIAKKDPTFEEFNQRVKIDQPFSWNNRMYLLPIPSSEVYNNPQLVQSPNY